MSEFPVTERNRLRRSHHKGRYDREGVYAVVDATPLCHVGYTIDGQPYVTPTIHWRDGDRVYWHGSSASRMLRTVKDGVPVCLTVTLFDGLILARAPFHHSANFRSAMLFGHASPIESADEKEAALKTMMDGLLPGRWEDVRPNTSKELKATTVVSMEIEDAAAKVRSGPPVDDEEDYGTVDCWAGELPLAQVWGEPVADPRMTGDHDVPDYARALSGRSL